MRATLAAVFLLPLFLTACGGGDSGDDRGAPTQATAQATVPATTRAGLTPASPGSHPASALAPAKADAPGARDFASIPRYPGSWIVRADPRPRDTGAECGLAWSKYELHYQSVESENLRIVEYVVDELVAAGWRLDDSKNEDGRLVSAYLVRGERACVPAGTAYLEGISVVARSALDDTIVFTLTLPSDRDPFAQ